PDIQIEDSYAISTEVANRKIAAGAKLIGHKVGLTSKAMQRSSMIDEPDYGHLLDDMMIADGAKTPHANSCRPRVQIELAFILGKPLKGPGVNERGCGMRLSFLKWPTSRIGGASGSCIFSSCCASCLTPIPVPPNTRYRAALCLILPIH